MFPGAIGCKGRIIRGENRKPLHLSEDLVLGHKEYVMFKNSRSGHMEFSRGKRNVYYHSWQTCIAPNFLNFDPSLHIDIDAVQDDLLEVHKELLK